MRYLKKFNEVISQDDLKVFCEQYLAYLLDEGYALDFRQFDRISQIDLVKPKYNTQHGSWSPGFGGPVDWMDWDKIKDHFIPFLQMLDKEYDIKENSLLFQARGAVQVRIPFQDVIDDKVEENIFNVTKSSFAFPKQVAKATYVFATSISSIRVMVTDHSIVNYPWQVKEAKEDWRRNFSDDELKEVCDKFLPYLYDEGFEVMVTVPPYFMFKKHLIRIWKEQETGNGSGVLDVKPFYWHEIKDHFLPLFDYLNKYYPLSTVKLVSYSPSWMKTSEKGITFKSDEDKGWEGTPFSKFEEVMSRDNAYGRPMRIEEILIEVQNLGEL